MLSAQDDNENRGYQYILSQLEGKDSSLVNPVLEKMEKQVSSANGHFKARLFCLKAIAQHHARFPAGKSLVTQFFAEALREAYGTGDEYLIALVSGNYGVYMFVYQEIARAVTYLLKAEELIEKLHIQPERNYTAILGEILFHSHDFKQSIEYTRKALDHWTDTTSLSGFNQMKCWNTIGLDYSQLGQWDSALANFRRSMEFAIRLRRYIWQGINSGDMGQVYFLQKNYAKAKPLLEYDYRINQKYDQNVAGYALHWIARIHLAEGKTDSAVLKLREALQLLAKPTVYTMQNRFYLQHVYYAMADAYRSLGNTDSFYYYFRLYSILHDSLQRVTAQGSIEIAEMRITNEKNFQAVELLQREKKTEELKRNFIIAAIILMALIAFLYFNNLRLQYQHKEQLALQQKAAAEAELKADKEQLQLFTRNIIEKTSLIEKLQHQVQDKHMTEEQQHLVDQLNLVTILTEEDWTKFKILFEKIYPGFFIKLKEIAPDITLAEQRMAALTRLHLSPKEMASMLGISLDSVHKTRQRLRHRLHLSPQTNLEESVAGLIS